jgi:hypothetical protein
MKRPSRLSRLTEPWVSVMRPPSAQHPVAAARHERDVLAAEQPSDCTSAEVSVGSRSPGCTRITTWAWKVCGSIRMDTTLPTFTPAIFTSEPALSPSTRSKPAVSAWPPICGARPPCRTA